MKTQEMAPRLQVQLLDPRDASLSAGSNAKVSWRCAMDPRHVWQASPNTRKRSGCPVCSNRLVLPGINDLATTEPDLAAQLLEPAQARLLHRGSHKKAWWVCREDSTHQWQTSVVARSELGSGCPYCSGRSSLADADDLATTHPDLAAHLVDPAQAVGIGAGSAKKLLWRCTTDPTHTWSTAVRNRARAENPTGCPHCAGRGNRTSTRHESLAQARSPLLADALDPVATGRLSPGSGKATEWSCRDCDVPHAYTMTVRNKGRGQGCPVAAGTQVMAGINDLATTHPDLAAHLVDPSLATTLSRGSMAITDWRCDQGHVWPAAVYARVAGNGCPQCCPIGSSHGEQEVLAVLRVLDPGTRHRVRLGPGRALEVDMVAATMAVEFNGLYWHSEAAGRDSRHHARKVAEVRGLGLDMLTVWEDDWRDPARRAVLVRTMAHRLGRLDLLEKAMATAGVTDRYDAQLTRRVGARELRPTILGGTRAGAFLRDNHVQGDVALTRAFALVDETAEPWAVLGLRSARHNARTQHAAGTWDIQRYATTGVVAGGFTRLLAHAERALRAEGELLEKWVSLSADESSRGALYEAAGFTVEAHVPPTYWYSGGALRDRRAPKEAFQLKRFRTDDSLVYEPGWTELEAAHANRMYRIHDAGKTRWTRQV